MKRCGHCKEALPVEMFGRNRARPDGLQDQCKACRRADYQANREKVIAAVRANYWATPPEVRAERSRRYHEENREALSAKKRERWPARREADNKRRKEAYLANLERETAYRREWSRKNAAANRARLREYYVQNAERLRLAAREWAKANPEKRAAYDEKRRARKLGNGVVELVDRRVVYERSDGICGICRKPVPADAFQVDHIIPLARGGEESYANTQAAHPLCNRRKHARLDYAA